MRLPTLSLALALVVCPVRSVFANAPVLVDFRVPDVVDAEDVFEVYGSRLGLYWGDGSPVTARPADNFGPGDVKQISWRAMPYAVPGSPCSVNYQPGCNTFTVKNVSTPTEEESIPCGTPEVYEGGLTPPPPEEIIVGNVEGYADLAINKLTIPDAISFYYNDALLYSFGCQGTLVTLYLSGYGDRITVSVTPECGLPTGDTRWGYRVGCVGDAGSDLNIQLEP